ncbi:hypothetical protein BH11MYX3_BH11MYX3_38970 [soil metagenome]
MAEVGSTANNYQILAKLAMGGMAEIFLARGASTAGVERYVVLKRIIRAKAHDTQFVQMFLDEARLAAQLQHANIAQVYDIGKLGESYFLTMEYVHGETVRGLLQRARSLRREIPLGLILTVIAGTAAGLHHAHERIGIDGRPLGIVHRDVSPSNLMIGYDGSVKVVDFGVAKAENRATETESGAVKGKISYLSPEQCRGAAVDRRSDLFALGIVLWEMLTIERLYRRASDFENMAAIVNEPPPSPTTHRPGLPPDIEQLALRLLSKRPDQRFSTAQELVEEIEEIAARNGLVLSISALGRFMKELFGQRPEPWIDLESVRHTADGVTVTSEPLPPELSSISDPVEGQLRQIRDLSQRFSTPSISEPSALPPIPTVNMRSVPPPEVSDVLAAIPIYEPPSVTPLSGPWPPTDSRLPFAVAAPTVASSPAPRANVQRIVVVAALSVIVGLVIVLVMRRDRVRPTNAEEPVVAMPPPADAAPAVIAIDAAAVAVPAEAEEPATCAGAPVEPLARECTAAACAAKDLPRARQWYAKVAVADRAALQVECRRNGIEVVKKPRIVQPPTTKPDPCKLDPMRCQR